MKTSAVRWMGTLLMTAVLVGNFSQLDSGKLFAAPKPEQGSQAAKVVNLNTATAEELETLRGIGPAIAGRILDYRKEHGRFERVEDLTNVRGIGEAKFQKMKNQLSV